MLCSLSDTLKAWHKRLHTVQEGQTEPSQSFEGEQNADETSDHALYEYVRDESFSKPCGTREGLGAATEEQARAMNRQVEGENSEDHAIGADEEEENEQPQKSVNNVDSQEAGNGQQAASGTHVSGDRAGDPVEYAKDNEHHGVDTTMSGGRSADLRSWRGGEGVTMCVEETNDESSGENEMHEYDDSQNVSYPSREQPPVDENQAAERWAQVESATRGLASELAEELRVILEPEGRGKLEGDYRTGKRLNMRKVIPYIASGYRKDKIWMRRTKASERKYQILLCIDDSKSMQTCGCGELALQSLATVLSSLSTIQVPELGVMRFGHGSNVETVHELGAPYSGADGPRIAQWFSFDGDNSLNDKPVHSLLTSIENVLDEGGDMRQLLLIVGDGHLHEKESLRSKVRDLNSKSNALLAFVALDSQEQSLLDMQSVSFDKSSRTPTFHRYMDGFPFPYYILVQQLESLPQLVSDLLRQWFELTRA